MSLEVNIASDTWPVVVDVSEFETALVNLVVNARDAMPDGGRILLSTRNEVDDSGKEQVEITLTDTGQGIPADVIGKVFDPFFTTKALGKGTGLGLSQVYGFAHQAGGKVTIASELGQGTSVTISLPRADETERSLQDAPPVSRTRSGMVLVVEDSAPRNICAGIRASRG